MARLAGGPNLIRINGHNDVLVERLREPLQRALAGRPGFYAVRVDLVGRVGEVLVSVSGGKGCLPLLFGSEDLEPGYVARVVQDNVERFGL